MHDYGHAPCSWRPRSRRRSTIPMGVRADQIRTTTVVDWHIGISSHGLCKTLKPLFQLSMIKEAAARILFKHDQETNKKHAVRYRSTEATLCRIF
jgi:hypothetical protein